MTVLVTGASGLLGSATCRALVVKGRGVRALVRPTSDTSALQGLGIDFVEGDVADDVAVARAVKGCDAVLHMAALLAGTQQSYDDHERINLHGTRHVLDAASATGVRTVVLTTFTFFDSVRTLTEVSPVGDWLSPDPYTSTKHLAYLEAMAKADDGHDVVAVVVGGAYGPAPQVERSLQPPSFNQRVAAAIQKQISRYPAFPIPWVYTSDVVDCVLAALDVGRSGRRYLAFGRPEDVGGIPWMVNQSCQIVGVDHRVQDLSPGDLEDPDVIDVFGPTLIGLAKRTYTTPYFDNRMTVEELGYYPRSLEDGLSETIDWLKANRII